jgi:hypothetical protein
VDRGVLNTVPTPHLASARIWFADAFEALVTEQYLSGESLQVKMLSATGLGRLAESAAPADSYTFAGRMIQPYPPGNVKVNNVMWPTTMLGQIALTWVHRDRMQQTVSLVTQAEGNIGPESGTTYTVRIYNENNALQKTVTGPCANEGAQSGVANPTWRCGRHHCADGRPGEDQVVCFACSHCREPSNGTGNVRHAGRCRVHASWL